MTQRKKPAKRKPAARTSTTVRRAGARDIRRWWKRKLRRARKRLAKKLNLTTTSKKMHPTPPPKPRPARATTPQTRTAGGKPAPGSTWIVGQSPGARPIHGPAAPMSQRVKRAKGGQFNGSTAATKKTTAAKKTVAPNAEQRRLLAANKKAAAIDARLNKTEQRIDRMFPEDTGHTTTNVANINHGGTVGLQTTADITGQNLSITVNATSPTPKSKPGKPRKNPTTGGGEVIGVQAGHIDESSAVYVNGRRVQ